MPKIGLTINCPFEDRHVRYHIATLNTYWEDFCWKINQDLSDIRIYHPPIEVFPIQIKHEILVIRSGTILLFPLIPSDSTHTVLGRPPIHRSPFHSNKPVGKDCRCGVDVGSVRFLAMQEPPVLVGLCWGKLGGLNKKVILGYLSKNRSQIGIYNYIYIVNKWHFSWGH